MIVSFPPKKNGHKVLWVSRAAHRSYRHKICLIHWKEFVWTLELLPPLNWMRAAFLDICISPFLLCSQVIPRFECMHAIQNHSCTKVLGRLHPAGILLLTSLWSNTYKKAFTAFAYFAACRWQDPNANEEICSLTAEKELSCLTQFFMQGQSIYHFPIYQSIIYGSE